MSRIVNRPTGFGLTFFYHVIHVLYPEQIFYRHSNRIYSLYRITQLTFRIHHVSSAVVSQSYVVVKVYVA